MIEAYKIGITVALVNQASRALALIGRDFAKTNEQAKLLQQTMGSITKLTLGGAALTGAGLAGLHMVKGWYDAAKEYEQAYSRFRALDLGASINKDADKFAQSTRLMGVSATELMTTVTDLHTVLGNYDHARALAPMISRMEFANKAVFDAGSKFDQRQALNLARVIEMRGGFKSPEDMKLQADFMQHVLTGTGGRVTPTDFLNFIKTAGVAGRLQNNDTFYYQMEPLIQELGGMRAGTGLMSAYQNLGQGRTTARTVKELMRLGLVDPNNAEFDKVGQLVRIKPGGVKGGDMVASDPMGFLKNVLLPAFQAKGITSEKAIINEIGTIFTNRTAASLFSLMYIQQEKIAKNMAINRNAMGVDALTAAGDKTPAGEEIRVEKAYENLRIQFGLKIIPVLLPMLEKLGNGLQTLAMAAERHPNLTRFIALSAAGLSVLAIAVGGIALVAGSIMLIGVAVGSAITAGTALAIAGIAAGIVALGAAVVVWWDKIKTFFSWVNRFFVGAAGEGDAYNGKGDLFKMGASGPFKSPNQTAASPSVDDLTAAIKASIHGTHVKMDGQTVGQLVTKHQGAQVSRPPTGPNAFDSRMSRAFVGLTG